MGNEGQKICGDLPETTAFKSYAAKQERRSQYANYSDLPAVRFLRLTHSEASEGYPTIVNNIQPCPKLCQPMPLAYVGARTDSTSYTATREAWQISAHAHWRSRQDMLYLRRGFSTLVLLVKLAMGYIHTPSFIILGSCIYELHQINGLYHNVWPRANFCHFLLFTSKQNCLQKN